MRKGRLELTFVRAVKLSPMQPVDLAAVELGQTLARAVDGGNLRMVKEYHALLAALGMTPKSRAGEVAPPVKVSKLDELRQRRAAVP